MKNEYDSIYELNDDIAKKVQAFIDEHGQEVEPESVGLDTRVGTLIVIENEGVMVEKHRANDIEYYGGFEYIDDEDKSEVGDYVLYSIEASRVEKILDLAEA